MVKKSIELMELCAIQGKTQGWYESHGYKNEFNDELETARIMREIHDLPLCGKYKFEDVILEFETEQKLGEIMLGYWQTDKCMFSKMYHALKDKGIFNELELEAGLPDLKVKIFDENINKPPVNIFD